MRYDVGRLPKKSMNSVYYSLDGSFAFKEERHDKVYVNCCIVLHVFIHFFSDFINKKKGCFSKGNSFGSQ